MLENEENGPDALYWENSYAIARELQKHYPGINLELVSLDMVYRWTIALPAFKDDLALANDDILEDIYTVWLEETLV